MSEQACVRASYPAISPRAARKVLPALDRHMVAFIGLSPFICLGSSSSRGADVSPRGDAPGFVRVPDAHTLLVPDWPGNNRLDSLSNVEENADVGLLFLIPGITETLRVNGTAATTFDPLVLQQWNVNGKQPRSALRVTVREAFLHCGKAVIRARLWAPESRVAPGALPSFGQMLKDQAHLEDTTEQIDAVLQDAYKTRLY